MNNLRPFVCILILICSADLRGQTTLFFDVTEEEGVQVRHNDTNLLPSFGTGAAWFDCDGDGDLDLFVANRGQNRLFRNNRIGQGTPNFTDITTPVIADETRDGCGVAAADYDNDGDMDLMITNYEDDMLLQNDGTGNFTDVTTIAFPGIDPLMPQFGSSAAWGDLNNDGWLDLYISNYDHVDSTIVPSDFLFISNGDNPVTFTDRSDLLAGDVDGDGIGDLNGYGLAAIMTDYNNDGWLDIFATNDCPLGPEGNKLWRNNGDLTFTEVIAEVGPFTRGITTPECSDVMGITRGDMNHDGWLDYHMTNVHIYGENTTLLLNNGKNLLNVSAPAGMDNNIFSPESGLLFTWGTTFFDYDLDTWQDIAFAGGSLRNVYQPNFLFHNEGADVGGIPDFVEIDRANTGIANGASTRTMIMADYDMDGDPDLFTVNFDSLTSLYRNDNDNDNNWLIVDLAGAGPPLSNRNGIGAKVKVTTPDQLVQVYEVYSGSSLGGGDDVAAYFGLGSHTTCDVQILWPSGIKQVVENQAVNQRIEIAEPYAYAIIESSGTVLELNESYTIRWKTNFTENVNIVLKKDGMADYTIATDTENDGMLNWLIDPDVGTGQGYFIEVVNANDASEQGVTNRFFSIVATTDPYAELVYPTGGELFQQLDTLDVEWINNGATGQVTLQLYEGNQFVTTIATNEPNNGLYRWAIPNNLEGNNFYIQLQLDNGFTNRNDQPFALVKDYIEFQTPDFGQFDADKSHARIWIEMLLEAIRTDFARPTVHARNLFHVSMAMYDAWAALDPTKHTYMLGHTLGDFYFPFDGIETPLNMRRAQEQALSFAAYRILKHRFGNSPGAPRILEDFDILFNYLGYDATNTSTDYSDGSPAALGNYIAEKVIEFGLQDGSNEQNGYENRFYQPINPPFDPLGSGNGNMVDPNRWQPLEFETFVDQGGNVIGGGTPDFLSPEWGGVIPFSLSEKDLIIKERDGHEYWLYQDPQDPVYLSSSGEGTSDEYKWGFELVSIWSAHLDPSDGVLMDISPASQGNVGELPDSFETYKSFYDLEEGNNIGNGYSINPATGEPYEPQLVPRGDYARVLAEFWADGPDSETPPGHWFTILNYVNDHPDLERNFEGQTRIFSELEWDVKSYFILGGAMHDVAVSVWGIKGYYDYVRPISAIRYMTNLGQSSDPDLPNYHPAGIELNPGYIEVIEEGDPLAGMGGENIGKIKLKAWKGHNEIQDPSVDQAGVDWILADEWVPYQRPTFVTPPFAGYVSGHSTFSRAAAEVLTLLTGNEYFPGGMSEFVAPKNDFLVFEKGPSTDIVLQWATYKDAADQCSLSRIWGGIHPPIDDIPGRKIGKDIGIEAFNYAKRIFSGAPREEVTAIEPLMKNNIRIYPNPVNQQQLHIQLPASPQKFRASVYQLDGRLVLSDGEINVETTEPSLDVSALQNGIYILRLTDGINTYTTKIIIDK